MNYLLYVTNRCQWPQTSRCSENVNCYLRINLQRLQVIWPMAAQFDSHGSHHQNTILNHMMVNKLISRQQYDNFSKWCTTAQVLECGSDWSVTPAAKQTVDIVYLDFSRAFDPVVHWKLFSSSKDMALLVDYDRRLKNFFRMNKAVWESRLMGPVMFLIYIN